MVAVWSLSVRLFVFSADWIIFEFDKLHTNRKYSHAFFTDCHNYYVIRHVPHEPMSKPLITHYRWHPFWWCFFSLFFHNKNWKDLWKVISSFVFISRWNVRIWFITYRSKHYIYGTLNTALNLTLSWFLLSLFDRVLMLFYRLGF